MTSLEREVHIRIRQDDQVVLRAAERLRALAGRGRAPVDGLRHVARPDEAHAHDIGMVADRLDALAAAVDHVEHAGR
jgi:hypothetical protein